MLGFYLFSVINLSSQVSIDLISSLRGFEMEFMFKWSQYKCFINYMPISMKSSNNIQTVLFNYQGARLAHEYTQFRICLLRGVHGRRHGFFATPRVSSSTDPTDPRFKIELAVRATHA